MKVTARSKLAESTNPRSRHLHWQAACTLVITTSDGLDESMNDYKPKAMSMCNNFGDSRHDLTKTDGGRRPLLLSHVARLASDGRFWRKWIVAFMHRV